MCASKSHDLRAHRWNQHGRGVPHDGERHACSAAVETLQFDQRREAGQDALRERHPAQLRRAVVNLRGSGANVTDGAARCRRGDGW